MRQLFVREETGGCGNLPIISSLKERCHESDRGVATVRQMQGRKSVPRHPLCPAGHLPLKRGDQPDALSFSKGNDPKPAKG
jgi:hypothetical protein